MTLVTSAFLLLAAPPIAAPIPGPPPERGSALIVSGAMVAWTSGIVLVGAGIGGGDAALNPGLLTGVGLGIASGAGLLTGGLVLRMRSQPWYRSHPEHSRTTGAGLIAGGLGAMALGGLTLGVWNQEPFAIVASSAAATAGISLVATGAVLRHRWKAPTRALRVGATPMPGGGVMSISGQF